MSAALSPQARTFLERQRVARLATADRDGRPHLVPFVYAFFDSAIYFVVDEKPKAPEKTLKRLRNIRENPRVAVLADVYDEDWARLEYVMVRGTAAVVEDEAEYRGALEALRGRYPQYRTMRLERDRNVVVRISPESVNHWRAAR